jgi:hypothetical protein
MRKHWRWDAVSSMRKSQLHAALVAWGSGLWFVNGVSCMRNHHGNGMQFVACEWVRCMKLSYMRKRQLNDKSSLHEEASVSWESISDMGWETEVNCMRKRQFHGKASMTWDEELRSIAWGSVSFHGKASVTWDEELRSIARGSIPIWSRRNRFHSILLRWQVQ